MPATSRIVTAVEIGTAKVVAVIGEHSDDNRLRILGYAACPARGVTKGVITDLKLAGDCAHTAIENAEKNANGIRSDSVFLALTGAHTGGYATEAVVAIQAANGTVTKDDVEAVTTQSRRRSPGSDFAVVHYIQGGYRIDDKPVDDPIRMAGRLLSTSCWTAYTRTSQLANSISTINGFNLRVSDVILSSLGSAAAVTTREERRQGVLVIDIGCGTTDYVLYRNGFVVATGVIAVGGQHVTSDLSLAMRCTLPQAETLKLRCGRAQVHCKDKAEKVWLLGDKGLGDRQVPLTAVERVCAVRAEELFQILKKRLEGHLLPDAVNMGVILTGGGSRLAGLEQLAAEQLGLPTRLGEHDHGGDLAGPEFSTVLGILEYGLCETPRTTKVQRSQGLFRSMLRNLKLA